jgi:hypothetical protein
MQLDCKTMTGVIHNCPNLKQCLQNSTLNRLEAMRLYFLNLGVKPEDIDANISDSATRVQSSPFTPRQRFTYNQDSRTRDTIIFGKPIDWDNDLGGAYYFDELTVEQLEQLVNQQFADPAERQNFSPTLGDFLAFAQTQKSKGFEFTFEGYVISPKREDYRVSIDGIQFQGDCSYQVITDFHAIAYNADELDIDPTFIRAWWD